MELERIRKMNDEQLEKYLKSLSSKRLDTCIKCGSLKTDKSIMIHNKKSLQHKKLCNLCDKCYYELLDYLGVADALWD